MLRHFIRAFDHPQEAGEVEAGQQPHAVKITSRAALIIRATFLVILVVVILLYIYHHFFTGDTASSEKMTNLASQLIFALALQHPINGPNASNQTASQ